MSNYEVIAGQAVMGEHPRALSWCVLNVERLTGSMTGSRRKVWKLDEVETFCHLSLIPKG